MKHLLLTLVLLLAVPGCLSSGNRAVMDPARLAQITLDVSTKDDVRRLLGPPNILTQSSGNAQPIPGVPLSPELMNREVWSYHYLSMEIDGTMWIPFIGPFIGGTTSHYHTLTLAFDEAGIVRYRTSSQSQGRSGFGAETGPPNEVTPTGAVKKK